MRKESDVAGNRQPSFLKRQKEQKRAARATEKREAKRLKKAGRQTENEETGGPDLVPAEDAGEKEPIDEP